MRSQCLPAGILRVTTSESSPSSSSLGSQNSWSQEWITYNDYWSKIWNFGRKLFKSSKMFTLLCAPALYNYTLMYRCTEQVLTWTTRSPSSSLSCTCFCLLLMISARVTAWSMRSLRVLTNERRVLRVSTNERPAIPWWCWAQSPRSPVTSPAAAVCSGDRRQGWIFCDRKAWESRQFEAKFTYIQKCLFLSVSEYPSLTYEGPDPGGARHLTPGEVVRKIWNRDSLLCQGLFLIPALVIVIHHESWQLMTTSKDVVLEMFLMVRKNCIWFGSQIFDKYL